MRGEELRTRVLGAGHGGPAVGQRGEDRVAPLDYGRVGGHDQLALGARVALGDDCIAALDGIADKVVVRRRLRQAGDDRRLGRADLREVDAKVASDRGLHAVALVPVVVLVQVGRDDVLLPLYAGEGLCHPHRLDDLPELALDRPVRVLDELRVEQTRPDQLLGDRRGAAAVAAQGAEPGGDDGDRVEAGVVPEGSVLDRGRRIEQDLGDLLESDDLAPGVAEPGELDLARAVVDDRLFGECVLRQVFSWRQARGQRAIDEYGRDSADGPEPGQEQEDDDRDPAHGRRLITPGATRACGGASGRHGLGRAPTTDMDASGLQDAARAEMTS